jgi:hypothetical protein
MADTSAMRQKRYRDARQTAGENGERRLNTYVATGTALALRRLSHRYGVTQREMLERLVGEADDKIISTLEPKTSEWDEYFLPQRLLTKNRCQPLNFN